MILVLAVEFSSTITLGAAIFGTLAVIATIVGVVYGVKYKVAYEAASAAAAELRASLSDEKGRVVNLEDILGQMRGQLDAAQKTIQRLEQLPDLAAIVGMLDAHEVRAQERHESVTQVLSALTDRLTTQP